MEVVVRKFLAVTFLAVLTLLGAPVRAVAETVYALAPPFFLIQFDSANPAQLTRVIVVSGVRR